MTNRMTKMCGGGVVFFLSSVFDINQRNQRKPIEINSIIEGTIQLKIRYSIDLVFHFLY